MFDNDYGPAFAQVYDSLFEGRSDVELVARRLHELAGGGPVLELGIGTGRLAVPLARRGVRVVGMDNAPAMLAELERKVEALPVTAVLGDMRTDDVEGGPFSLAFVAFSSLYLIGGQEDQVMAFRNTARHLVSGGKFLVEGFFHNRHRFPQDQQVDVEFLEQQRVGLRIGLLDPVEQVIKSQHVTLSPTGIGFRTDRYRYITPAELDLMARLAGMRLLHRWGDWSGGPFSAASNYQIATYVKVSDSPL